MWNILYNVPTIDWNIDIESNIINQVSPDCQIDNDTEGCVSKFFKILG